MRGPVVKIEWTNPHAWFHVEHTNEDGTKTVWMMEAGTPNTLLRRGIHRNSVPIGTEVVIDGYQSKDLSNSGNGRNMTFANGQTLFMGSSGTGAPERRRRSDRTAAPNEGQRRDFRERRLRRLRRVTPPRSASFPKGGDAGAHSAGVGWPVAVNQPSPYAPSLIHDFAAWVDTHAWSTALHESLWVYPLVESTHVLTLMLFVGMLAMVDLRMLGVAFRDTPVSELTSRLLPWSVAGFVIMVGTGVLLFYAIPVRTAHSVWFRVKVVLLIAAAINAWWFHRRVSKDRERWDAQEEAAAGRAPGGGDVRSGFGPA